MLDNKAVKGDNHKMGYQNYKDLEVYQLAHKLAVDIHAMASKLPRQEMYEESSQIRKSSKSICSNIVEGFGRRRYKNDFIQFLTYALASCDETREHLELLHDTDSLHDEKSYKCLSEGYNILGRKLTNFISAVETNHLPHKTKNPNLDSRIQDPGSRIKGVTLIIVVFAMMLLGVLGWTLARMQATDFESNLRTFEPDNALNLAEAGAQWALNRLSTDSNCRSQSGLLRCPPLSSPLIDTDCNDSGDWLSTPHSLSPGQYNLCLRDACSACTPAESGDAVIVSRGYIPSQSGSRVMRQIKLEVELGSLTNAVQTQVPSDTDPQQGLFDWSQTITDITPQPHTIQIEGNIEAGHYNGDGDATYDETGLGQDYKSQPAPILPDDRQNPESETRTFTATYPAIDMSYFYALAPNSRRWPNPDDRKITFTPNPPITTLTVGGGGAWIQVNVSNFFNNSDDTDGVAIRRTDTASWWTGAPGANWTAITNVTNGPGWSRANVLPSVTWLNNTPIKLVKYFNNSPASGVWYIGKQIAAGEIADTLIDLQNNNINFDNTYLITEADTVIKGANRIRMRFTGSPPVRYPELATQNGNIISLDLPAGATENSRRDQRRFAGLIYSQNGLVTFDYLRGTMVYGNKVTFNGTIRVDYSSGNVSSGGFIFKPTTKTWKEE